MPRPRRKEIEVTSLRTYFQSPGEAEKEPLLETEEPTLREIKKWLEEKFHGIGSEVKSLKAAFTIFDEKLICVEGNLSKLERTVDKVQAETINIKQATGVVKDRVGKLEGIVRLVQEDVEDFGREYDELESTVESLDNNQRKNNLKIRGLKEGAKGPDLKGYLTGLFSNWIGSEAETDISVTSAFPLGPLKKAPRYATDIIVKLPYVLIEGNIVSVFPDLAAITLRKRKLIRFLTSALQE